MNQNYQNVDAGGSPVIDFVFDYDENWNQFRKMVKFTPSNNTARIRIEFNCKTGGTKGMCFIDAPMLEPFIEGEYLYLFYRNGFAVERVG